MFKRKGEINYKGKEWPLISSLLWHKIRPLKPDCTSESIVSITWFLKWGNEESEQLSDFPISYLYLITEARIETGLYKTLSRVASITLKWNELLGFGIVCSKNYLYSTG